MANELIFDSSAKKTAVFQATIHHPKWPYQGTSAKLRQGSQINWNSQLKSKHNLHNIFNQIYKLLYIR